VFLIVDKGSQLHAMKNTRPSKASEPARAVEAKLAAIGAQIRAHLTALHISATAAAEAAGMSRITRYRIEKGEPSVTTGAYLNAMAALGLNFGIIQAAAPISQVAEEARRGWLPARIRVADYPQLSQLAWQVQGGR
jgi:transcriptional regulator with XRE-family HTH domain